jgi:hypothetical protein
MAVWQHCFCEAVAHDRAQVLVRFHLGRRPGSHSPGDWLAWPWACEKPWNSSLVGWGAAPAFGCAGLRTDVWSRPYGEFRDLRETDRDPEGFQQSAVFATWFQLTRRRNDRGRWAFDLAKKSVSAASD